MSTRGFEKWTPQMVAANNVKFGPKPLRIETAVSVLAEIRAKEVKKKTQKMVAANHGSKLEQKFAHLWAANGGPELKREHRFAEPRRWRFDFAHMPSHTALELQGGNWINGAHNRGAGMERDCEKYLAAFMLGWRVVTLTPNMVNSQTISEIIQRLRFISGTTL